MIILGIDPGLADTGYGIIEKSRDNYKYIACGSIKTSSQKNIAARLLDLRAQLARIIKKHKPAVAAVEELFFAKNAKTAIAVAQARGVIILTTALAGLPVREFTPLQVKLALTGYGRADKNQIQQMVKNILRLKSAPRPDDAADALAVAICCGQTKEIR